MNAPPVYRLADVAQCYGNSPVLEIDALEVPPGDVLCLLGPTGAGKSTLLRLLAGLERPTRGQVQFNGDGFQADRLPIATRRRIAMVHQRPHLLTGSVQYNVEYGLRIRAAADRGPKAHAALAQLGIESLAHRWAHTLSGGQAQLAALARALVIEPEVLLLDEPTANLDPARVVLVERVVEQMRQSAPRTIVWATHNLFQARRVARRVALLWDGKLVEVAPTEQFFHSPSHPRTRDFVEGRAVY
jgi:tungstate transport system ATP-binding protein